MNTVIKCESYRFARSKEVKIITLVQIGIYFLVVAFAWACTNIPYLKKLIGDVSMTSDSRFFDGFADQAGDNIFKILMVIMVASLITKLYQSGVVKQLVSSGVKRKNIILGQFTAVTAAFFFVALILAVASGLLNFLIGGKMGLTDGNYARLLLSIIGMLLVVASEASLYMLVAHLTGSMGAATAMGMVVEMVLPNGIMYLNMFLKWEALNKYYINTVQRGAVAMTGSISTQLVNMGVLVLYTVIFVVLTQIVFSHKDVK